MNSYVGGVLRRSSSSFKETNVNEVLLKEEKINDIQGACNEEPVGRVAKDILPN